MRVLEVTGGRLAWLPHFLRSDAVHILFHDTKITSLNGVQQFGVVFADATGRNGKATILARYLRTSTCISTSSLPSVFTRKGGYHTDPGPPLGCELSMRPVSQRARLERVGFEP